MACHALKFMELNYKLIVNRTPKKILQTTVLKKTLLLDVNRFPALSRTSSHFPGLSSPGKCHNKIQGLSRFSRTRTNPVEMLNKAIIIIIVVVVVVVIIIIIKLAQSCGSFDFIAFIFTPSQLCMRSFKSAVIHTEFLDLTCLV